MTQGSGTELTVCREGEDRRYGLWNKEIRCGDSEGAAQRFRFLG